MERAVLAYRYIASNIPASPEASDGNFASPNASAQPNASEGDVVAAPTASPSADSTMEIFETLLQWRRQRHDGLNSNELAAREQLRKKVMSQIPQIKKHWAAIDEPAHTIVSPLPTDETSRAVVSDLFNTPFNSVFNKKPDAIGCGHRDDCLEIFASYAHNLMLTWLEYFCLYSEEDDEDEAQEEALMALLPERWIKWYDECGASDPPRPRKKSPPASSSAEAERRDAFGVGLVERMMFALLIPHPSELGDEFTLVMHVLPSIDLCPMFAKHTSEYGPALREVSKSGIPPLFADNAPIIANRFFVGWKSYSTGEVHVMEVSRWRIAFYPLSTVSRSGGEPREVTATSSSRNSIWLYVCRLTFSTRSGHALCARTRWLLYADRTVPARAHARKQGMPPLRKQGMPPLRKLGVPSLRKQGVPSLRKQGVPSLRKCGVDCRWDVRTVWWLARILGMPCTRLA